MIKIVFICETSGRTPSELLELWRFQTPEERVIWKNLQGVNTTSEANYYIILERIPKQLKVQTDYSKVIYFQAEPSFIHAPEEKTILPKKDKFFAHFDYKNFHQPTTWWSRIPFKKLENLPYKKNKQLSCIMTTKTMKRIPGYAKRLNFLEKFIKKYGDYIEVYGRGTENKTHSAYKGPLNYNKFCNAGAFVDYRHTFICENCTEKGHFTERVNDCILNWSIPIYWGAPNIYDYYPKEALYTIDIEKDSIDKLYEISQRAITQRNINALRKARQLILYKYNIWETIYQVIEKRTK